MNRFIHYEIPASDPGKLIPFYKSVFGWNIQKWGGHEYWLAFTGDKPKPGRDGAFFKPKAAMNGDGFVNTIQVENIDGTINSINQSGEKIVVEKMTIPGLGYYAYAEDIEENLFGLIQEDRDAK